MKKNKMIKRWLQILFVLVGVFFEVKAQTPTTNLTAHLVSTSAPSGATLEWHNALPIGAGNIVATPTTVAPGTYYAVYNLGSCYSIPSPLRVITNTCPSTTVDIRTAVDSLSKPTGTIITFHSDTLATTANQLSASVIANASAGTYYVAYAQFDALSGTYCYSKTSTIVVVSTSCIQANPDAPLATAGLPTTIPVL
ncbi:MAG: hypothetical protein ACOVOV_12350, partial [Dolichospermum sp.]